ncbi:hypothetical protein PCL_01921 [Purpureocillium lilacinum]|uniref:PAS domain-containing protein n=1 Tax=Purpureocillium lilacinum TaxID=33203 RepID=A0A2U3DNY3_PURLI|nr:hypothetical protein PCL_01921 [Purpureocillium lilacinum]
MIPAMSEIFDLSPVPSLLVSPSHCIERASNGLLEAWGLQRDEVVGRDLFVTLYNGSPTERFDCIPLSYAIASAVAARTLRQCHAAYLADNVAWNARITPLHRGEKLLCLIFEWEKAEAHATAVDGEIFWHWLPIDDAFRTFIQAVKNYAMYLLDTRGYVMTWNTGAELSEGYKRKEILSKHLSMFYGEEDGRAMKPERQLEVCLREGRVEFEVWLYRKDGSRYWANVLITALYKNDVHVGFGNISRDLTGA